MKAFLAQSPGNETLQPEACGLCSGRAVCLFCGGRGGSCASCDGTGACPVCTSFLPRHQSESAD